MKVKLLGIVGFLGAAGWFIAAVVALIKNSKEYSGEDLGEITLTIISAASTVLYILLTRFGFVEISDLKRTQKENNLLKIQIEQKKLKSELAAINN